MPAYLANLIKNIKQSPVSTVAGLLLAASLAVSHQPDARHLVMAFATALMGAVYKES
jgi:hypothetical protein